MCLFKVKSQRCPIPQAAHAVFFVVQFASVMHHLFLNFWIEGYFLLVLPPITENSFEL